MAENKKVTISVEELALSNSVSITALVELLQERGFITREEVFERIRATRERKE